jgi:hypothetical protein
MIKMKLRKDGEGGSEKSLGLGPIISILGDKNHRIGLTSIASMP